MDAFGSRVARWALGTSAMVLIGLAGAMAQAPTPTASKGPRLDFPAGIASDGSALYVANSRNNTIDKIDLATHGITQLAGKLFEEGSADGNGDSARFSDPEGVALVSGTLYVADTNNSTIRKIQLSTVAVSTLAGSAGLSGSEDGSGPAAHFNTPTQMTTDGHNLYIADSGNNLIRKIELDLTKVSTIGGKAGTAGKADGPASASQFNGARGVATDGKVLYVADTGNDIIRKIDLSSTETTTVAGSGEEGDKDGTGKDAQFNNPGAIALSSSGDTLYVADADNHAIRKINLATGEVKTVTQLNGHIGSGVACSSDGHLLFISDTTENAIQAMDTANGNVNQVYPPM